MRILKTTLFILVFLVIGLPVFLLHLDGRSVSGSSPVETALAVSNAVTPSAATEFDPVFDSRKKIGKPLISRSEETDFVWTSQTPAAKRVREIIPDTDWMSPFPVLKAGDVITLALFDDAVFDAKVRNVTVFPSGAVGMTAHLTGKQGGAVYLSYTGQKMRASVEVMGGADYYVRYDADTDVHYAVEIDPEKTITRACGGALMTSSDVHENQNSSQELAPSAEPLMLGDVPAASTVIDVMIVYTPAALSHEGGSFLNMDLNIAQAMQRANDVHANSDTQIELRLVHSALIDYAESGNDYTDLDRLTDHDGYMDEVHTWRNEYRVDFVCLFSDTATVGGLGWLQIHEFGGEPNAFCLAAITQTDSTYVLAHEWGHNMGCSHSKTQEQFPWAVGDFRSYSAGWQWSDTMPISDDGYCTVMTYKGFGYGLRYEQVAHFSNPDISYTGDSTNPTGHWLNGDNARTIREMKEIYEAYRESIFPSGPDWDNDGLPNEWELQYFGGETNANPSAIAANGVNTVIEAYIAGISPVSSSAFFTASLTNQGGFVVSWNAVSGRVYSVHTTSNLLESFLPLQSNILWPQSSWTDTVERSEHFYQVDVKLSE